VFSFSLSPWEWFAIAAFLGGVMSYAAGWRALRRKWTIASIPTSKARSVAMGMAELAGKAKSAGQGMVSPLRQVPCVWYRLEVIRESEKDDKRSSEIVLRREQACPFFLQDETGRVLVIPQGAEIHGVPLADLWVIPGLEPPADARHFCDMNGIPWRLGLGGARYRIREWALIADADVYVLGEATRAREYAGERMKKVSAKLREWLSRPEKTAEFDLNRDGLIQPEEWDAAKASAHGEVLKEDWDKQPEAEGVHIKRGRSGYFIIASGTEKEVIKAQGYPVLLLALGLGLAGAGFAVLPKAGYRDPVFWAIGGAVAAWYFLKLVLRRVMR